MNNGSSECDANNSSVSSVLAYIRDKRNHNRWSQTNSGEKRTIEFVGIEFPSERVLKDLKLQFFMLGWNTFFNKNEKSDLNSTSWSIDFYIENDHTNRLTKTNTWVGLILEKIEQKTKGVLSSAKDAADIVELCELFKKVPLSEPERKEIAGELDRFSQMLGDNRDEIGTKRFLEHLASYMIVL